MAIRVFPFLFHTNYQEYITNYQEFQLMENLWSDSMAIRIYTIKNGFISSLWLVPRFILAVHILWKYFLIGVINWPA